MVLTKSAAWNFWLIFLKDRKPRFVLNGQISNWADVNWADEFPKDSF